MHQSIATIDAPQFINLQPLEISPLMSSCEIKVLYLGENRNHSYITKEVATEMAKTLRGAPIVGYYKEEKGDFRDHGERLILDDEGIHFECLTVPYGFVSPDAQVWFKKFEEQDEFGNVIEREYLMTTGYIWTGQFEEAKSIFNNINGKPQSMEIDEESLEGHWATNSQTGMDFYIINDATFSKLCILGEDVEPCFEGSSIKAPEVSKSFSLDDDFKRSLYNMMQELQFALKGGQQTMTENISVENQDKELETIVSENEEIIEGQTTFTSVEETQEETIDENVENAEEVPSDFACGDKEKKCKNAKQEDEEEEVSEEEPKDDSEEEPKEDKEDEKKKYSLLENQYNELESKFEELNTKYQALVAFKEEIDNQKKDEIINKFYMLSDEDKADVIANKAKYTIEEINSKLSVIYTNIKMSLESTTDNDAEVVTTLYVQNDNLNSNLPDWVRAVKEMENLM